MALILDSKNIRTYSRSEAVVFAKTKEKFGGLSNMASGYPLYVNQVTILTTEALYQACRYPHAPLLQQKIIEQVSPMSAKEVSREFDHESRQDWIKIRHQVMRWCLRIKLAQNFDSFGQLLLSTKELPIVELSYKDEFWGARPLINNPNELRGQNNLGRLLMELRELLKNTDEERLKYVTSIKIPNFTLLGSDIDVITNQMNIEKSESIQSKLF
ncbi:NADAR family protein [Shewanella frigidimarina]|jgi:ribA/ribD-fused uncharacterized protein|uniref:NADAR family protein n=1 Tax=Shewanella frigidimarina TaxID=56812 RepID=UPI003D7AF793